MLQDQGLSIRSNRKRTERHLAKIQQGSRGARRVITGLLAVKIILARPVGPSSVWLSANR